MLNHVAQSCFKEKSRQNSPRVLEQIARLRAGRVDRVRFLHIINEDDSGTNDEPLKGFRSMERRDALLKFVSICDLIVNIYSVASPRETPGALKFFSALKTLVTELVESKLEWVTIDKHVSSILRTVSCKARSYSNGESSMSGADFKQDINEDRHLMDEINKDLVPQLSRNAAEDAVRSIGGKRHPTDDGPSDHRETKKQKQARLAKEKESTAKGIAAKGAAKPQYASGVTPGAAVPFPGVASDDGKSFNVAHPPVEKTGKGGKKHTVKVCWDFFHPQGCSRGVKCFHHHP